MVDIVEIEFLQYARSMVQLVPVLGGTRMSFPKFSFSAFGGFQLFLYFLVAKLFRAESSFKVDGDLAHLQLLQIC